MEKVEYSKAEALYYRREEIKARRVSNIASISDIDKLDYKDRITNPKLDIIATLRINKKLE